MTNTRPAWLVLLLLLMLPKPVLASKPIIELRKELTREGTQLELGLTLRNASTQRLLRIVPTIEFAGAKTRLEQVPVLPIASVKQWRHRIEPESLELESPGTYPVFITIEYNDASMFPHSHVDVVLASIGTFEPQPALEARAQIAEDSQLVLSLRNGSRRSISTRCALFLPSELAASGRIPELTLDANEERRLEFRIANRGASLGSVYQIFAVLEYGESGVHRTAVAPATFFVEQSHGQGDSFASQLTGIVIFLAIIFVITLLVELRAQTDPR